MQHVHRFVAAAGGTGGSVSPLLALLETLPESHVVWIGTRSHWAGEQQMMRAGKHVGHAEVRKIVSGKLRRYRDIRNLIDPLLVVIGFFQSFGILWRVKPCAVLTAGSYVAVPVAWAAWVLRIPVVMYQQDASIGLANRLIVPAASLVLCIRNDDVQKFNPPRLSIVNCQLSAHAVGALIRSDRLNGDANRARAHFCLEKGIPTVLVIGGGTGSQFLNHLIVDNLGALTKFCQIIHVTGARDRNLQLTTDNPQARYHPVAFLGPELADCYAVADLVVTRAGMGVLTELAANKKAAVVFSLPNTHQEENGRIVADADAGVVLSQNKAKDFATVIQALLAHPKRAEQLASNLYALFPRADTVDLRTKVESVFCCAEEKK